jgi:protein-tyrosine-phosphatase
MVSKEQLLDEVVITKNPFHIHFICTGNVYRSRLAEAVSRAHLTSQNIKNIVVSSSGLEAILHKAENGPISWYARKIAEKHGLTEYIGHEQQDTTLEKLEQCDLIIFMHPDNFLMFTNKFGINPAHYEVWEIPDLYHQGFLGQPVDNNDLAARITATQKTFASIHDHVIHLFSRLHSA